MKFNSIEILRGFASVFVVLAHVRYYMEAIGHNTNNIFSIFTLIFNQGAILFFVISGFLMCFLIDTGYSNFLIRRIARIYPTYFLVATAAVIYGTINFPGIPQHYSFKSLSLLPFGISEYSIGVEWTLVYEIFFYFICSIFTISNFKRFFPHFLVAWIFIILGSTPRLINMHPNFKTIFFDFHNIFFIAGAFTYYLYKNYPLKNQLVAKGLILSSIVYFIYWPFLMKYKWFANIELYTLILCCCSVLIGSLSLKNASFPRFKKVLMGLGECSYALYLVHMPVIVIVFLYYIPIYGPLNSKIALVAFFACLICGWLVGKVDVFLHNITKTYLSKKHDIISGKLLANEK